MWETPITVPVSSAVPVTYFDTVKNCLDSLQRGGGETPAQTVTIAADGSLDVGTENSYFEVSSGIYDLQTISTAGRELGNTIDLYMVTASTISIRSNTPPDAGYATIILTYENTVGDWPWHRYTYRTLKLTSDGWVCSIG